MEGIDGHDKTQETMALLKIMALNMRQIDEGKTQSTGNATQRPRNRSKFR